MQKRRGNLQFSQSVRIIIFILLFVVLFILYQTVFQAMQQNVTLRRERVTACENAFTLMQEKMDDQLLALTQMAAIVHEDEYLRRVSLREHSIVDVLDAQNELKKLVASNRLLGYVHYYARNTQTMYTMSGVYRFPESTPYYLPFRGYGEADMRRLLEGEDLQSPLYLLPSLRSEHSVTDVIVAVVNIPYNSAHPYATLLVELSKDKLLHLTLPSTLGEDVVYAFYREDGTPLFATGDTVFKEEGKNSEEGLRVYTANGKTYYRFADHNYGSMGLTYEMYVPEGIIQAGAFTPGQMRLLSVGCLGLLLLLCPVLYMWVYQPMRLLIEQLAGAQSTQRRGIVQEDYAIALREIEQMRRSNNSLLWKIDSNMNLVRASLLRHALEYGQKSEDFLALCQHADLNFQYPYFRLILVSASKAPQRDVSEYMRLVRPGADIYLVKTPDILYALVNAEHEGEIASAAVVELVQQSGYTQPDDQLHIARSAWMSDLLSLHEVYRSTREKLSIRVFHGKRSWEEEPEQHPGANARRYPANEILRLQEAAMAGDVTKMREAVLDVQNFLLHESTQTTAAVLAASDVLHVLAKSGEADLSAMHEAVHRKGTTAADICRILGGSLDVLEEASTRQEDTLTEAMMVYISEMLESPNLSIATVSEHFGLSESAFSHAFKKRTGGTFAKYVTDLKLQRAKALLICTDLSVEAIADRLNYASASSFARMFKSETAFTPTQYRRLREKAESHSVSSL